MTVVCKSCEFQYGAWRPQCPTCGTLTPYAAQEAAKPKKAAKAPRVVRHARECVFCHLRAKRVKCPHCNEPVHQACLTLHEPQCKQFQLERVKAEQDLVAH